MNDLALLFFGFLGGLGWGATLQEKLEKRRLARRIESRIVVDAPFSPAQAEIIMKTLGELADSARPL